MASNKIKEAKRMDINRLYEHPFLHRLLRETLEIQKHLNDKTPAKVTPSYDRDPNEHEFYILKVGHAVIELHTWCEQLDHSVLYISNYHETPAMRKAGINRHKHLVYHLENYLIRMQSLYDRVLQLVDGVFHLLNAPSSCTHQVVVSNLKVKRTKIPATLKKIRELLSKYTDARHTIVHHESHKEDLLRILAMYHILEDNENMEKGTNSKVSNISELRKELTRELTRSKKQEFSRINKKLFTLVNDFLTAIEPYYALEEKLVSVRVLAQLTVT